MTKKILHIADLVQEGEAVQQEVEDMQKNLVEADQSRAGRRSPYKVHK